MNCRYFLVVLLVFSVSHAMEPQKPAKPKILSHQYVPGITTTLTKERNKFKKYHMDEASFTNLINTSFSKGGVEPGSKDFITDLATLLRLLYLQHEIMKKIITYNILATRDRIITEETQKLIKDMASHSKGNVLEKFYVSTIEGINFLMNHITTLKNIKKTMNAVPADIITNMKTVFTLKSYPSPEVYNILQLIAYGLDENYTGKIASKALTTLSRFMTANKQAMDLLLECQKYNSSYLIEDNLHLFQQAYILIVASAEAFLESSSFSRDFLYYNQTLNILGELYKELHPLYETLYNKLVAHFLTYITPITPQNIPVLIFPASLATYQEAQTKSQAIIPVTLPLFITDPSEGPLFKENGFFFLPTTLKPLLIIEKIGGYYPATQALQDYLKTLPLLSEKESKEAGKKPKRRPRRRLPINVCPAVSSSAEASSSKEPTQPLAEEENAIAEDGSYIEQNDDLVVIKDPKNQSTISLFRTNIAKNITIELPLSYTKNIDDWFNDPQDALKAQGYFNSKDKYRYAGTEKKQKEMVHYHSFALVVDDFLPDLGLQSTTESRLEKDQKDILIVIPGTMQFDNKETEIGVFTYLINAKTGKCYHRMFTPESLNKQFNDLLENGMITPEMTGLYDVYFPPLGKAAKSK